MYRNSVLSRSINLNHPSYIFTPLSPVSFTPRNLLWMDFWYLSTHSAAKMFNSICSFGFLTSVVFDNFSILLRNIWANHDLSHDTYIKIDLTGWKSTSLWFADSLISCHNIATYHCLPNIITIETTEVILVKTWKLFQEIISLKVNDKYNFINCKIILNLKGRALITVQSRQYIDTYQR